MHQRTDSSKSPKLVSRGTSLNNGSRAKDGKRSFRKSISVQLSSLRAILLFPAYRGPIRLLRDRDLQLSYRSRIRRVSPSNLKLADIALASLSLHRQTRSTS